MRLSGSDFISQWVYGAFSEGDLRLPFSASDLSADATVFLLRPPSASSAPDDSSPRVLPAPSHHFHSVATDTQQLTHQPTARYLLCLGATAAARDLFFGAMFHTDLQVNNFNTKTKPHRRHFDVVSSVLSIRKVSLLTHVKVCRVSNAHDAFSFIFIYCIY